MYRTVKRYGVVILFSGGADSFLLERFADKMGLKPYFILIDYEQLHSKELEVSKKYLDINYQDSYHTVKLHNLSIDSGLTSGVKNESGIVHTMHVPMRNTIFLSIACSYAEANNISSVWIGSDWSDRLNLFPDCYQEYIVKINELIKVASPAVIKIEAPLMGLSKEAVLSLMRSLDPDKNIQEIFSGYGSLQ